MKVISIKEQMPKETKLSDGLYQGRWSGHVIVVRINGRAYDLETEIGVKGLDVNVVVTVKDGEATFVELKN